MSLHARFSTASQVLGVPLRSASDAALGLVVAVEIVQEQRAQLAALTARVERLERAAPRTLAGRLLHRLGSAAG